MCELDSTRLIMHDSVVLGDGLVLGLGARRAFWLVPSKGPPGKATNKDSLGCSCPCLSLLGRVSMQILPKLRCNQAQHERTGL